MKKIAVRMIPMCIAMSFIFYLSHQSGEQIELPFAASDKLGHLLVYFLLGLSLLWWLAPEDGRGPFPVALLACCLSIVYGVSDEIHQSFIPGRTPSLADIAADGAGSLLASLLWFFYSPYRRYQANLIWKISGNDSACPLGRAG